MKGLRHTFIFCDYANFYAEELSAPCPTSCHVSRTAYSIYLQLPSMLEAVPPSTTQGHAMPR